MRRFSILLGAAATVFMLGCETDSPTASDSTLKRASPAHTSPTLEWVEEVFIDYGTDPVHAGPGPHPETESDRFRLTQGGVSWLGGGDVEYKIVGAVAGASGNTAIEDAIATWDGFITTRDFTRDDNITQANLCGSVNTVQWVPIDGVGRILATASVCIGLVTREIAGFVISLDEEEPWGIGTSAAFFDVQNVTSHEFGHAAGLGHVNAPQDGCLTMYALSAKQEIQKRTLGLGDKLGMETLYGFINTTPGVCGL